MEAQALKQESPQWITTMGAQTRQSSVNTETAGKDSQNSNKQPDTPPEKKQATLKTDSVSLSSSAKTLLTNSVQLSEAEQELISRLKARDQEVRTHEASHLASAGQYATSGASYTYQEGPNGRNYAVGGEVTIDVSPVANDPEATISKAETIMQSALSPASPSPQDFKVADQARQMRMQATRELAIQQAQEQQQTRQEEAQQEAERIQERNIQTNELQQNKLKQENEQQTTNKQNNDNQDAIQAINKEEDSKTETATTAQHHPNTEEETAAERDKRQSDHIASLTELFTRYDEARKTYQAIIDFFTNQYERSKSNTATPPRIELFA